MDSNEDYKNVSWLSAVRKGDWKLIYFQKFARLELSNLKEDISEQHDLASFIPKGLKL